MFRDRPIMFFFLFFHSSNFYHLRIYLPALSLNVAPLPLPRCSKLAPVTVMFLCCFLRWSPPWVHCSLSTKITTNSTMSRAETTPIIMLIRGVNRNGDRCESEIRRKVIMCRYTQFRETEIKFLYKRNPRRPCNNRKVRKALFF